MLGYNMRLPNKPRHRAKIMGEGVRGWGVEENWGEVASEGSELGGGI